ncbi:efflux RND transporter permease subunit [Candidatus Binatus sp.]|uniref:efflux RND transporter permease subunit n=1 Tax=Candidatus Binatus sp. TaxID=2811406 RepID=UPI003BB02AC2
MSISETTIRNSVGTTLLTIAIALAGIVAFYALPVAPLPAVDFPTIQVQAQLPGASPQTMATSVGTPLERQFGHIASLTQMTSSSFLGQTTIVLQFDLSRNIDAATRDVQAAINAASSYLPANLPSKPTYRKVNPSDPPVLILALTSKVKNPGQLYDAADSILEQKLSTVEGVGQVVVGGGALPAVRVELNPTQLRHLGISLEQVRSVLASANTNSPTGEFADDNQAWTISTTDQLLKASEYKPLIVGYHNGTAVTLSEVADVEDSVQNVRASGYADLNRAILVIIWRAPGANVIDTVDRVYAALPALKASIPASIDLRVVLDRTTSIRSSVKDVEGTLLISICLVVMVVFLFLRNLRATIIPGIAVPISLIGTFGVMYLCGFSIDNLSLMALTISTGFVVDDAIVVVENISRYLEQGMSPYQAAVKGTQEIGFTVVSISLSLVAVFIPLLLMGGLVGRLFREFAITLSTAVAVSMVISLTTTPMMCAKLLRSQKTIEHGRIYNLSEQFFDWMLNRYEVGLKWVLKHSRLTLGVALLILALNIYLFYVTPKGFFPEQDNGRLLGAVVADQDTSFQAMNRRLKRLIKTVLSDPNVDNSLAFTGTNGATNTATMYVALKPRNQRKLTAQQVIGEIRKKAVNQAGLSLYLQAQQDLTIGGRSANAEYQYTLMSNNLDLLMNWAPKLLARLQTLPQLTDVSSDQQYKGLAANLTVDRDTASRLGLSASVIDNTLYDAFGQREVSTMYTQLNQYYVVMEVAPQFWQNPDTLKLIHLASNVAQPVVATASSSSGSSGAVVSSNEVASMTPLTSTFTPPATGMTAGIQSTSDSSTAPAASSTTGMVNGVSSTTGSSTANFVTSGSTITALPGVTSTTSNTDTDDSTTSDTTTASQGGSSSSGTTATNGQSIVLGNSSTPNNGVTMLGANSNATSPGAIISTNTTNAASTMVPIGTFSSSSISTTPLTVNHQGQFPAVTISFNLAPGVSLGDSVELINQAEQDIHLPAGIWTTFAGTAQAFQASLSNEPMLILAALLSVYIVLGILYESYVHPITILSTLPSAGVGALLALRICGIDLSVIALIGIILLIGIVKKNAILMIDFALDADRNQGKSSEDAIYQACVLRFRPIMMTTMAALLGGLPLAVGTGYGSELRRPLGVAIVGGLIVSQMLTLFTTPVIYLYLDRLRLWGLSLFKRGATDRAAPAPVKA